MQSLIRLPAVLKVTAETRSTHYLRIKQGLMTPPVKLGERAVAWPSQEIASINAARIAGRSVDEIRLLVKSLIAQRDVAGVSA